MSEIIKEEAIEKVLRLLEEKKLLEISKFFKEMLSADIAELIDDEQLEEKQRVVLFRLLQKDVAADVFVEMDNDNKKALINSFNDNELHQMLDELFIDDTVDIIEEMPANVVRRIIKNCTPDTRNTINKILEYPSDSAGSIMTPEYIALRKGMTVKEAFDYIRKVGIDSETIYTCYVVEPDRRISGVVTVKELLLAKEDKIVSDIMHDHVIYDETTTDK